MSDRNRMFKEDSEILRGRARSAVCARLIPALAAVSLSLLTSQARADALDPANPSDRQALSTCHLEGLSRPARCGTFHVPENREAPQGRRIAIGVAVVPASGSPALADPIVPLMGGPGEDAISAAGYFADRLSSLLQDRDLLLIDQRGTGRSGALGCQLYDPENPEATLRDFFPPKAVEKCARELEARADLTRYTYLDLAHDIEHVRRALGYGELNLFAASYGTRAAQVFVRAYPRSVRTVFLGSVVPIDVPVPPTFARTTEDVLERTFVACGDDAACRGAFPNLRDEFHQILARLDSGSVRVALPGRAEPVRLYRDRVTEWFRSLLYRPSDAAVLPWTIHRAYEGDWRAIAEGILSGSRARDSAISSGLFFSITCSEDVPFMSEEDIARATRDTVLGDYRPRQQIAACCYWPKAELARDYRSPIRTNIPTMFVSGDTDAGSPLWFTQHVAPGFSNRIEIIMRGRGHTEWDDCVGRLYERFVRNGDTKGLDAQSCKATPRPPFKTKP
ncbi:MAG TPA: alpha/beta fold hydrolase [Steroidobacter sp.]